MARAISPLPKSNGPHQSIGQLLGPLLCWAVVFQILDLPSTTFPVSSTGGWHLAGFFVLLTMSVFVLLTLKYAEVSARFPEGGGVVTVAAQAINSWVGALGGMFILVSYFLTAAISCLAAVEYFSVIFPVIGPMILEIAISVLCSGSAELGGDKRERESEHGRSALIAFISLLAIIWTVFTHIPIAELPLLFAGIFTHETLTPASILVGFAGAFLAFSGLESISQLSPSMKLPARRLSVWRSAVIITIGVTSPLL